MGECICKAIPLSPLVPLQSHTPTEQLESQLAFEMIEMITLTLATTLGEFFEHGLKK